MSARQGSGAVGARARRSPGRALARLALVGVLMISALLGFATPAHAADDSFDRWDAAYTVRPDGTVHVQETITLRFGSSSGRRGLERTLVTREAYNNDQDAVFQISGIRVSSPDPVSTNWTQINQSDGRTAQTTIRVGDANRRISAATATYVFDYDVRGYLRSPSGHAEFGVDVLGPGMARIDSSTITVTTPAGITDVTCFAGTVGSKTACTNSDYSGETATFRQNDLPRGQVMTVGVQFPLASVQNPTPILEENVEAATARSNATQLGVGSAGAVVIALLGIWYYRRNGYEERFGGLPPGTFPAAGSTATVVKADKRTEIPVAFSPPRLPLMDAGYLLDGRPSVKHLTATMVNLAVVGAIELRGGQGRNESPVATARDPRRIPDEPSDQLFREMFPDGSGQVVLDEPGAMEGARKTLFSYAERNSAKQGWFRNASLPTSLRWGVSCLTLLVFAAFFMVSGAWGYILLVLPIMAALLITVTLVQRRLERGKRTATGRAYTDQIEGFRTYIATAEAEQLKFEEGEDIFSRYLPWAILFGLAERWVAVCQRAVELGIMSEPDTAWYGGTAWNAQWMLWNLTAWNTGMASAAVPAPPPVSDVSSGTGFGGGSMFGGGGGGFAGGGFGGGGGGSW